MAWILITMAFCVPGVLMLEKEGKRERSMQEELRKATSLQITYIVAHRRKSVTVTDAERIKEIVAALAVRETRPGIAFEAKDMGAVEFVLADKTRVRTMFVGPKDLERIRWGAVFLKSDAFYKKVCEVASKAEGRPIDVLKDN